MENLAISPHLKQGFEDEAVGRHSFDEKMFRQFSGDDDDIVLNVAIYTKGDSDIVDDVAELLQEYGFTRFSEVSFAPGSWAVTFTARFEKNDDDAAEKNKKQLQKDLLRRPPLVSVMHPEESRRAGRLEKLWKKIKKSAAYVLIGGVLLWGGKEVGTVVTEELIKDNAPVIVQKVDDVLVREYSGFAATRIHGVFQKYIDDSDKKETLPPPSPTTGGPHNW